MLLGGAANFPLLMVKSPCCGKAQATIERVRVMPAHHDVLQGRHGEQADVLKRAGEAALDDAVGGQTSMRSPENSTRPASAR